MRWMIVLGRIGMLRLVVLRMILHVLVRIRWGKLSVCGRHVLLVLSTHRPGWLLRHHVQWKRGDLHGNDGSWRDVRRDDNLDRKSPRRLDQHFAARSELLVGDLNMECDVSRRGMVRNVHGMRRRRRGNEKRAGFRLRQLGLGGRRSSSTYGRSRSVLAVGVVARTRESRGGRRRRCSRRDRRISIERGRHAACSRRGGR
mmetsp:Transcript_21041/g.44153  ORF Transcript_21041/g.44153 Transcript_21041/m.44153 type:complete len:200 (+) Transcript_21041:90-689(+)